ncbi:hypothetical protein JCM12107_21850 [Corynebacterium simulans]
MPPHAPNVVGPVEHHDKHYPGAYKQLSNIAVHRIGLPWLSVAVCINATSASGGAAWDENKNIDAGKRPNHGRGLDLLEADPATGNNRNQGKYLGTKLGALHWVINKSAYMAIGVDIEAIKHI